MTITIFSYNILRVLINIILLIKINYFIINKLVDLLIQYKMFILFMTLGGIKSLIKFVHLNKIFNFFLRTTSSL